MKKGFVFGFLSAVILAFAFIGFASVASKSSPMADRAMENYAMAPPPAAAPMVMEREEDRMSDKKEAAPQKMKRKADEGQMGTLGFGGLGLKGSGSGGGGIGYGVGLGKLGGKAAAPKPMAAVVSMDEKPTDDGEAGAPAATRAWFPETFLFEPLVVTDAQGKASVPVKVPDRLTSWRVLALAHSRQGGQAGTVTSFLGTLPTYVDPVMPPFLIAGDEVRIPVQVVNTTESAVSTSLKFTSENATLSAAGGPVKIEASGNVVQYVTLKAPRPGTVAFKATLGNTDAIEKTVDVAPAGRRVIVSKGGTLASPRTITLDGPAAPLEGSERVALQVFPGALSLLRAELSAAPGRGGVAEDGYTLLLAGKAPELLHALGGEADKAVLRDLSVLASQRVIRHARNPDVATATLLTEAALAHPENPVLQRLGVRLSSFVASKQRPDGTCSGADGWTLQRLLVTTSECVQAVRASQDNSQAKQRATLVSLKASGAFERNLARVADGYTAAAILASGAVTGTVADKLKEKVLASLKPDDDGGQFLEVDKGVVRSNGVPPSRIEATALAVLALKGDSKAPLADLGTYVLSRYNPVYGWGDGKTNLVALRAVLELFKEKVPADVKITLSRDGKAVVTGALDPSKLMDVLSLEALAPGSAGEHKWTVAAEPAVPGLGFSLTLQAHVPWKDEGSAGLELKVTLPEKMEVSRSAELQLTAAAPSNTLTVIKLAIPAGVQADTPSLDALVSGGTVNRYETEDGAITLHLNPLRGGATFEAKLKVIPTLAGTLHAAATTYAPEIRPEQARTFAPKVWTIR